MWESGTYRSDLCLNYQFELPRIRGIRKIFDVALPNFGYVVMISEQILYLIDYNNEGGKKYCV